MNRKMLIQSDDLWAGWMDFSEWDAAAEERSAAALSVSRKERVGRIENEAARRQSIAAGYLLESILRERNVEEPYVYGYSPRGKPFLEGAGTAGPYISMAHTAHAAVAAVSFGHPVGIDLEDADRFCVNRAYERMIASRFFSDRVRESFQSIPDGGEAFLLLWTAAEAAAKALDEPLVGILPQMEYTASSADPVTLNRPDGSRALFRHFRVEGGIGCLCQILL